ncbi:hypothetical protein NKJ06_15195 [Mesorhizobium sp. M0293]|uniref:hypothetical protein n=1 Tax=Mesorhizobium sp. M0293 TaxID=2956930 RepID=UPI003338ACBF
MKDLSSLLDMTIDQMAGDWCEHQTRHAGRQQHDVNQTRTANMKSQPCWQDNSDANDKEKSR